VQNQRHDETKSGKYGKAESKVADSAAVFFKLIPSKFNELPKTSRKLIALA
jgi:hypothetical protein